MANNKFIDDFKAIRKKDLRANYSRSISKIKIDKSGLSKTERRRNRKLALLVIFLIILSQIAVFSQTKYFDFLRLALRARDKTFLVGFQNSGELRPTGGFWGSFAVLKVENNFSKSELLFETNPYKKDNALLNESKVELPKPMAQTWQDRPQTFVNANWSFSFPDAAKTLEWYFAQGWNQKVDGVFAVSSLAVIDLLKLTGEIDLPDGQKINSENFTETMSKKIDEEYWLDPKNKEINEPKTLLKDLAPILLSKVSKLPKQKLASYAFAQLKKGQVLFFFNDEKSQKIAKARNISGEMIECKSDCLSIVNANLNGGKTSLNVEQSVAYEISKIGNEISANLEVSRIHKRDRWPQILNRNWTRVAVPLGSKLESVYLDGQNITDQIEVSNEGNRTTFGFWFSTDPGEEKIANLTYKLPINETKNYSLIYQKQPGTIAEQLSISKFGIQVFEGSFNQLYRRF